MEKRKLVAVIMKSIILVIFNLPYLIVAAVIESLLIRLRLYTVLDTVSVYGTKSNKKLIREFIELSKEVNDDEEDEFDWCHYRMAELFYNIQKNFLINSIMIYSIIGLLIYYFK